jgi:hypothetical protein
VKTYTNESVAILSERIAALAKVGDERDRRYEDRFTAMDEKTGLALTSSEKAVNKADAATEKRFDGVNEFRETLKDQAATFITRAELNATVGAMEKDISSLRESRSETSGSDRTAIYILGVLLVLAQIVLHFWK